MGDKAYSQPIRYLKKYVPLDSLDALDKAEREWNPYIGTFVVIHDHKHVVMAAASLAAPLGRIDMC